MNEPTGARIESILRERFQPEHLELVDESYLHAGHAQAKGGGHFRLLLVSAAFEGLAPIERHRRVHEALRAMLRGEIHALSMRTLTPEEWKSK